MGLPVTRERTTLGISYVAGPVLKVQLNWILRHTEDKAAVDPDPANDTLIANLQAAF